jgi:hypothetical protein
MENVWRVPANWSRLDGGPRMRVDAPAIKARMVKVRAIGPRRFLIDGQLVAEGAVVNVSEHDAPMLVFSGKAEYL